MTTYISIVIIILFFFIILNKKRKGTKNKGSIRKLLRDTFSTSFESSSSTKNKVVRNNNKDKKLEVYFWAAQLLDVEQSSLINIAKHTQNHYNRFNLKKRKGGFRVISAPSKMLMSIQRTINHKILSVATIHDSSKGYRENMSVLDNALPHLGRKKVLKIDLADFFGSIRRNKVIEVFTQLNYNKDQAKLLADLCLLRNRLPQGAPTSPAISNIVCFEMDIKLSKLALDNELSYSRYADDLTFSGDYITQSTYIEIDKIIKEEQLIIQRNKTQFLTENSRKIITGVSISSGKKATIPKSKKREIRKNVYFILTKGLTEHQRFINSTDPSYLKRLIGNLNFWLMIEPDNEYVRKSLEELRRIT